MKRITLAVVAVTAGTAVGCKDMGLDGNIPLREARERDPLPLVAAVTAPGHDPGPRVVVDGRLWVAWGLPLTLGPADSEQLRPIGAAGGETVYARRWDRPPYGTLFVQLRETDDTTGGAGATRPAAGAAGGQRWIALAPVQGRTGPPGGGERTGGAAGTDAGHGGHGGH